MESKSRKFYLIYFVQGWDEEGYVSYSMGFDRHHLAMDAALKWHDMAEHLKRFELLGRVIPYHKLNAVGVIEA